VNRAELEALAQHALAAQHAGRSAEAEQAWRAALNIAPDLVAAHANLAGLLAQRGALDAAIESAHRAVRLAPHTLALQLNLLALLQQAGRHAAVGEVAAAALAIGLDAADLHYALGLSHDRAGRLDAARACYAAALTRDPHHGPALSEALYLARSAADWPAAEQLGAAFRAALSAGVRHLTPFVFLAEPSTPAEQRLAAQRWAADLTEGWRSPARPAWQRAADGRLTVGYLSADLFEHPTAQLAAGVFERHDRTRFRSIAYSTGPDDGSAMRARLQSAFELFHDCRGESAARLAARIRADGVHLLVDLKGYTADAASEVFALRPAPVQLQWLGYPGTLGAPWYDAVIADATVIPPDAERDWSERVLRLACYQPNDPARPRPATAPARGALGLPESGFVFCCFNASWKVDRAQFDDWLAILRAVPDSVLWLLDANPASGATARWQAAAQAAGVEPARLVFAPRRPQTEYLAQYLRADLFLDTHPYGAHTTASDALWMACPVLTRRGATFASRVGASLLAAVGMPTLTVDDRAAYRERAIEIATTPGAAAALRLRLDQARPTARLFDADAGARELEACYFDLAARAAGG
jgi:protein O-GlcNAc transferase